MISRAQVLSAFKKYNDRFPDNNYKPSGKKVWYEHKLFNWIIVDDKGQPYPIKRLYSIITKSETPIFNTSVARSKLEGLGFDIIELNEDIRNELRSGRKY